VSCKPRHTHRHRYIPPSTWTVSTNISHRKNLPQFVHSPGHYTLDMPPICVQPAKLHCPWTACVNAVIAHVDIVLWLLQKICAPPSATQSAAEGDELTCNICGLCIIFFIISLSKIHDHDWYYTSHVNCTNNQCCSMPQHPGKHDSFSPGTWWECLAMHFGPNTILSRWNIYSALRLLTS